MHYARPARPLYCITATRVGDAIKRALDTGVRATPYQLHQIIYYGQQRGRTL